MPFENSRKDKFLRSFPAVEFNSTTCNHAGRCKFNFSYFDAAQAAGQDFGDWEKEQICKLLEKLKEYSKNPLSYWLNQRCGAGGLKILEIYDGFPRLSDFEHPQHIPKNVRWARFRLEGDMRLIGFLVPAELIGTKSKNQDHVFDGNAFYVTFLDNEHRFYRTKKR